MVYVATIDFYPATVLIKLHHFKDDDDDDDGDGDGDNLQVYLMMVGVLVIVLLLTLSIYKWVFLLPSEPLSSTQAPSQSS